MIPASKQTAVFPYVGITQIRLSVSGHTLLSACHTSSRFFSCEPRPRQGGLLAYECIITPFFSGRNLSFQTFFRSLNKIAQMSMSTAQTRGTRNTPSRPLALFMMAPHSPPEMVEPSAPASPMKARPVARSWGSRVTMEE